MLKGGQRILIVSGIGGAGKTQLVRKFIHTVCYDSILGVDDTQVQERPLRCVPLD